MVKCWQIYPINSLHYEHHRYIDRPHDGKGGSLVTCKTYENITGVSYCLNARKHFGQLDGGVEPVLRPLRTLYLSLKSEWGWETYWLYRILAVKMDLFLK